MGAASSVDSLRTAITVSSSQSWATYGNMEDLSVYLQTIPRGPGGLMDARDKFGWSMIFFATWKGRVDCLKLLIEYGASMDLKDNDGQMPVFIAAREGHLQCMELLFEAGSSFVDDVDFVSRFFVLKHCFALLI